MSAALALKRGKSVDFTDYWRHRIGDRRTHPSNAVKPVTFPGKNPVQEPFCQPFVDKRRTYNIYRSMTEPEPPSPDGKASSNKSEETKPSAQIIALPRRLIADEQPDDLSEADAIKVIRLLAVDSDNIVIIPYGDRKTRQRKISRPQVEKCVRLGTIQEGPFLNRFGHWQMNLFRHAAGEQVTCVVAIDWATRILVINAF